MRIRVLGCSGAIAAGCKTTAFLLDNDVLVDAGTGVGDLHLQELAQIDHIVLSHSHLDHVLSIPLLADSVLRYRVNAHIWRPIHIHAQAETLDALRKHIFNGVLWPDFTRLPTLKQPVLVFEPFNVGDMLTLGGKTIEVLPAFHTVPAVGFGVETPSGWWVYTGDTGPNPPLWSLLQGRKVAALIIETAFSNAESNLAALSGHLSPGMLSQELKQLNAEIPVYVTHTKPGEMAAITEQIRALDALHVIEPLISGQTMEL
jgi:ribonuclease BN (tRNA processing enzyme)